MPLATSTSEPVHTAPPSASQTATTAPVRSRVSLYMDLTKARLSSLVLLTTAVGFVLAMPGGLDWWLLLVTMIGTALAAASAAALNQIIEVRRDARMLRTRNRPLPSGALGINASFVLAVVMAYLGVGLLAVLVNLPAAWLALATIVLYAAVYTPMKTRSTLNTLVGAICGALPPMIGWVAARGMVGFTDAGAWVLVAILFIWQLPHFFALAWLYREDYARGGYVMLPVVDGNGELTGRMLVLSSLMLLPLGLYATMLGLAGWVFLAGSVVLGAWMVGLSMRFYTTRSDANARRVFLASIIYLSALLGLFLVDRGPLRSGELGPTAVAQVADLTELHVPQ